KLAETLYFQYLYKVKGQQKDRLIPEQLQRKSQLGSPVSELEAMVSEAETGESENEVRISQLEDKCARLARIVSFYRKRDAQSLGECQRWREEAKRLKASQWDLIRQRDCLQKRVEQANKQIWLRSEEHTSEL